MRCCEDKQRKGSQIPPSQQVKQKIHGKRQLIQQPAQSPLNVDVVPIRMRQARFEEFSVLIRFLPRKRPYQEGAISRAIWRERETVYERLTGSLQEVWAIATAYFSGKSRRKACHYCSPSRNDPQSTTLPQKILAVLP